MGLGGIELCIRRLECAFSWRWRCGSKPMISPLSEGNCSEFRVSTYLPRLPLSFIYAPAFNKPYPVSKRRVDHKVCDHGRESIWLCHIPAQFPVKVEEGAGDGDGRPAESQPDVCLRVDLLET